MNTEKKSNKYRKVYYYPKLYRASYSWSKTNLSTLPILRLHNAEAKSS